MATTKSTKAKKLFNARAEEAESMAFSIILNIRKCKENDDINYGHCGSLDSVLERLYEAESASRMGKGR